MAVSPHLLAQLPAATPKLLLRGVVNEAVANSNQLAAPARKNWVVFSGTHEWSQGLEQMVQAWQKLGLRDWELHIAGRGPLTPRLLELADGNRRVVFHGFLNREENARLLCAAKIGMNPQDPTLIPGTSFAFKIIEYLAAGLHVITTPRGLLEPELETGITYINQNDAGTIAASLKKVIEERKYQDTASEAALRIYGPDAMRRALNEFVEKVASQNRPRTSRVGAGSQAAIQNP